MSDNNVSGDGVIHDIEFFLKTEFGATFVGFLEDSELRIGDLFVLTSYGIVNRNGKDTIVLIDFGVTDDVYQTYYS